MLITINKTLTDEQVEEIYNAIENLSYEDFTKQICFKNEIRKNNKTLNRSELNTYYLKSYPIMTKISTSLACNLECIHCGYAQKGWRNGKTKFINPIALKEFIKTAPALNTGSLFREGEPFLYNKLSKLVHYLTSLGVCSSISTNASIADEKLIKELIKSKLTILAFSIDGGTKETVERIRKGLNFDTFIKIVDLVNLFKQEEKSNFPELRWHFVAFCSNIHELPTAMKLAIKKGFTTFILSFANTKPRNLDFDNVEKCPKKVQQYINEALDLAKKYKIRFDYQKIETKFKDFSKEKRQIIANCKKPWTDFEINSDGTVLPCCGGQPIIGDLSNMSFEKIWNNDAYLTLRKNLLNNTPDEYCKNCHYIGFREQFIP